MAPHPRSPSPVHADERPTLRGYAVEGCDTTAHMAYAGERPSAHSAGHATEACSVQCVTTPLLSAPAGERPSASSAGHATDARPAQSTLTPDVCGSTTIGHTSSCWLPSPLRPAPSEVDVQALTSNGAQRTQLWESIRWASISAAFQDAGIEIPQPQRAPVDDYQLNKPLQAAMSAFIRHTRPSLKEFVELLRCQTPADYRPNKALLPALIQSQCKGYPQLQELVRIASEGVRVQLMQPLPKQPRFPRNHPSAVERINVLRKNIRKEQDLLRCFVVDADIISIWPEIVTSPFGVVDKGGGDPQVTGRTIHDLSFPEDESVNYCTDATDVPKATFAHCSSVAREIIRCKRENPECEVKIMAGDVAAAYRNACIHSESVYLFGGHIPEDNAIVIDMSAAFGWCGSAGTYGVLGGAVAYIHGNSTDPSHPTGFFNYHWVDDHVNVAADTGSRCATIERSLRFAMTAVMGPAAVNEDKFTSWSTHQKVLGLIFDTVAGTVAMPAEKIARARHRVRDALGSSSLTRSEFRSLIGSLRHVATCVRPAQVFLQRLRLGEARLHRFSRVQLSAGMRGDLPEPDLVVSTDASDVGLCALVPALRCALTYQFTPSERAQIEAFKQGAANEFDINYRELLACAFAIHAWAPSWRARLTQNRPLHVHFRVDNTSAVAWQTKLASRNTRAQVLIRLLGIWEQQFGLRISASHIPGIENEAADAGSRQWGGATYSRLFDSVTAGWELTQPPASISTLDAAWRCISANTPLLSRPSSSIPDPSTGGRSGHSGEASRGNSTSRSKHNST